MNFEINGKIFNAETSFPPIDEEHIQNSIMIAPHNNEMYVYGWGCYNYPDGKNVWEWEPLFPLSSEDGMALIHIIQSIRDGLGI